MRLKVSENAAMFWDGGRLVWDDYVRRRQFELTERAEWLCRWFRDWRDAESVTSLGADEAAAEGLRSSVAELVRAGVLITEDSAERETERLNAWQDWGTAARYYHYATRMHGDTVAADGEDDARRIREKAQVTPPPAPYRAFPGHPFTPAPVSQEAQAFGRSLEDVLTSRRTTRRFDPGPIGLTELSTLLEAAAGPSPTRPRSADDETFGNVFKTSPSGGARHPIELYVHAQRVTGLRPGFYHFDPVRRGFEDLGVAWSRDQVVRSAADQAWIGEAAAVVYYTAVLARSRWKYGIGRTYRIVLMDLGHLSQTVYLLATALGLGAGFSAAIRDEEIEKALGCDPDHEIPLGVTALGRPTGLDQVAAALSRPPA
ncbi:SagB/ThcOx family dehydrogenase [Actinomadura sp. DC4]|uniref:SagB/ThcOx family dehydrogenase n=1 Tax=Actinomadura sp. DC4 TaxID=3055069 RepID=UPI0025B08614|nr:SagB/ThcOx family dehydrogenase [Actinomadura sp. DC4]MDN3358572.1 SagB/ThcOx family dehydrogenase [Actinomadura sp. DC4]